MSTYTLVELVADRWRELAGRRAIQMYAVGARDAVDFMDFLPRLSNLALEYLYIMLTTAHHSTNAADLELNALLAPIVKRALEARGIKYAKQ